MATFRKMMVRPELGAVTALIGVFIYFAITAGSRGFLTPEGTINYLEVGAEHGILAVSVALLMIAGEFDLSIGSMIGAAGMIIAIPVTKFGWPPWLAIMLAFAFSLGVGYLNGWLVVKTRLPSFIITLASLYLLRGLTFGLTIALLNYTRASGMGSYMSGDPLVTIFTGRPCKALATSSVVVPPSRSTVSPSSIKVAAVWPMARFSISNLPTAAKRRLRLLDKTPLH